MSKQTPKGGVQSMTHEMCIQKEQHVFPSVYRQKSGNCVSEWSDGCGILVKGKKELDPAEFIDITICRDLGLTFQLKGLESTLKNVYLVGGNIAQRWSATLSKKMKCLGIL